MKYLILLSLVAVAAATTCPGGTSECPGTETCCALAEAGQYGCCKFSNAVCCSDHQHCCPSGYSCDLANSTCDRALNDGTLHQLPISGHHATEVHIMTLEEKAEAAESNPEHHHERPRHHEHPVPEGQHRQHQG